MGLRRVKKKVEKKKTGFNPFDVPVICISDTLKFSILVVFSFIAHPEYETMFDF